MNKRFIFSVITSLFIIFRIVGQDTKIENSLNKHVNILASDSLEGRGFGYQSKILTVNYLTKEFASSGFKAFKNSYVHSFEHNEGLYLTEGKNIIGLIEGTDPILKNEYIVIGAHYDHLGWVMRNKKKIVYNGADDNASGVASIIEIGKLLLASKTNLKRSVLIIAFDGEEAGLIGSTNLLTEKVIEPTMIKMMFSLDMVGMYKKNGGVDLNGLNSVKHGEDFVQSITKGIDIKINQTSNSIEKRTDTWSFALQNIPAVYVTTGLDSPYHKPEDDSNLLDYSGMSRIVYAMAAIVSEFTNKEPLETNKHLISRSVNPKLNIGVCFDAGNNFHRFANSFYKSKGAFAAEIGLVSQIKVSPKLIVKPAVTIETIGAQNETGALRMLAYTPQLDILFTTYSKRIDVPFFFVGLGGYYRYYFAGFQDSDTFDFEKQYFQNESGVKYSLGFQYLKFQLSFIRKYGIRKINKDDKEDIFNRSNYISIIKFF